MTDYKVTGGCLCGGVKFEITKKPSHVHTCHCSICRKSLGADFLTAGAVSKEHFKLIKDETLKEYPSSKNGIRCFCGTCGGGVFAKCSEEGELANLKCVFVIFGALDDDPGVGNEFHIYVKDKAPWVNIKDGLPQSDQGEILNFEELM